MRDSRVFCILDFETYSEVKLKAAGAFEYSMHDSTEVLCLSFRCGTKEELPTAKTYTWSPYLPSKGVLDKFLDILDDEKIYLVAHNAFFDHMILRNVLGRRDDVWNAKTPFERWLCTAAMAAALALPRKLEDVCEVLKTKNRKDKEGNRLIRKWCKPRTPTKKNPSTRHTDQDELRRILKYCENDISASVDVFLSLPELSVEEQKIWLLDQKMNFRGFRVDRKLIQTCRTMIDEEFSTLAAEAYELTEGAIKSTSQTKELRKYLDDEGLFLPNLQKGTVDEALESGMAEGVCKRLLEIRQQESLTSLAKYDVAELCSRYDGRIRDTTLYHGASTGRWAGRGFQPHNLKRCSFDMFEAIDFLKRGDAKTIELFYGDVLSTISECIRGVVVPAKGHILDIADYNAIELRVLLWVAQDPIGLQALREGKDLYKIMASQIFKIPVSEIGDDSFERFVGKQIILGCGFGMGFKKFVEQCARLGKTVTLELGKFGIDTYRKAHKAVPTLWRKLEEAAISAVLAGDCNRFQTAACTRWYMEGDFLWCELPNGRKLAYYGAHVRYETDKWDRKKPVLYHWGTDPKTKQWVLQKTWGGTLTENVVQAVARDLVVEAALRTEEHGWKNLIIVHDEIVAERDLNSSLNIQKFEKVMEETPWWAGGCPIKVKGFSSERYRK